MRRLGTILVLAGSAALLWCLWVLGGAALFQWRESRRFDLKPPSAAAIHIPPPKLHPPRLHDVLGRLEIPRLHVSTVILEGDDARALRLGAGHVPGTAFPYQHGNVGIAAHRDTFFRPLRHIAAGDRIALETLRGTYTYSVEFTEIVHPTDVGVLQPSRDDELTLVTCYPFYYVGSAPMRFIVHARRVA